MGKPTGFKEFGREGPKRLPVHLRVKDYQEFYQEWPEERVREQGARCMNCAVPFCHTGCPLGNVIPDWNDLVYRGRWKEALDALNATNNFPEFTGRICPAPCEAACVLAINEDPVTIEYIEKAIADRGFQEGWIKPEPAGKPHRQEDRRCRLGARGPGLRPPAKPGRPPGHRLRTRQLCRRPSHAGHTRLQARQVHRGAARRRYG